MEPATAEVEAKRDLGRRIRALRRLRGLTQEQLGERSGVSAKYISELERGVRNPSLETLVKVANIGLVVSLAVLFFGVAESSSWLASQTEPSPASRAADPPGSYQIPIESVLAGRSAAQQEGLLVLVRLVAELLDHTAETARDTAG
jgi:transcriptional regulator with XRE-family HTH domain